MIASLPEVGADFDLRESDVSDAGGAVVQLMKQDPSRWGFVVSNPSGKPCAMSMSGSMNLSTGIFFPVNSAPFLLYFTQGGAAVQAQWFMVNGIPGGSLHLVEFFYRPKR